jgi:hypothetical protein
VRVALRYGCPLLLVGSLLAAALLWLLPINEYEFHACDPDGLAIATALLLLGIALTTGAAAFALFDRSASKRRKRILLGLSAALLVVHMARGPELIRERSWTNQTCDVEPTG